MKKKKATHMGYSIIQTYKCMVNPSLWILMPTSSTSLAGTILCNLWKWISCVSYLKSCRVAVFKQMCTGTHFPIHTFKTSCYTSNHNYINYSKVQHRGENVTLPHYIRECDLNRSHVRRNMLFDIYSMQRQVNMLPCNAEHVYRATRHLQHKVTEQDTQCCRLCM